MGGVGVVRDAFSCMLFCEDPFEKTMIRLSHLCSIPVVRLPCSVRCCWLTTRHWNSISQIVSAPSVESTTVAEMAHYGSKVDIVSREQIERAGPAADVSRVMQMFIPGLYVAPKNGPFDYGTYSLLGGRNDDTLILLDGVRLNNRLYGGLYLDTLPANAIERIEVLKGGQSLLFGTQAVSGVINIVTRSPQSRKASGEVNMGLDTFGGTTGDARVENIFSNGFGDLGLLAYVIHNVSDGYQPFRNAT